MSTFLGIVSGSALLFYAIIQQGGFAVFVNPPALMIVMGGTLAAIFISFPLPRVLKVAQASLQIFRKDIEKPLWAIAMIVRLAVKARQKSLMSLEKDMKTIRNRFLRMGLEMIIDGHPGEVIRDVLETESDFVQIRHRSGAHIFQTSGKYSPAFGLIGTLIGLVAMMRGLGGGDENAAKQLGMGMAVALLTTFYGAMMANLFFFPIAEKLRSRSEDESLTTRIVIEGILMIQAGINPRMIERKLNSFLPPHLRAKHFDRAVKGRAKGRAKPLSNESFAPAATGATAAAEDDF
ncbi:MAG TPA: MotA/TolQ/ExbB proton channel family protein [Nitrospinota bacterium]|jgi:chemotaxis protein MotA|nr:MotA/TolQ/ExbB proton channel family protein [Nitrospinota bacterium]